MTYPIDSALLSAIQELGELRDATEISGSENWKIRIRDAVDFVIDELQPIHALAVEPEASPELRNAISGLQIGIQFLFGALASLQKGIAESDVSQQTDARAAFWGGISYANDGMNRIVAALDLQS